ncbi:MAG: hypothetical protein M0P12_13960 [Paludibacteraceae bacterium]|jgi:hypothetical protein|nr:hypothetical protein [Paludibacteraceae bacterium]
MEVYQQRVIEEKKELDAKIEKLSTFVDSKAFPETVEASERSRLLHQLTVMREYSSILSDRIANFK